MFDRIFADEEAAATQEGPPTVEVDASAADIRRARAEIGSLPEDQRRFLARYAYILVRMARSDVDVNDTEVARIEEAVIRAGGLTETQAALMVALAARTSSLYGTSEDYAVTREFARTSSPQERQRLLRACFAIGAADGPITSAEVAELYEIGQELSFAVDEIDAIRDQVAPPEVEDTPPPG